MASTILPGSVHEGDGRPEEVISTRPGPDAKQPPFADDPHLEGKLEWPAIIWIGLLHLGTLLVLVPSFFSWTGVALFVVLFWLTGGIGVCLGYHRLLTHGSFQTYKPIKWLIAFIGGLAGEGSALFWVAMHRRHHAYSDHPGDPHSPRDGKWWSHILWLFRSRDAAFRKALFDRWIPDLTKDPVMRFLDVAFLPIQLASAAALFGIGYWYEGFNFGMSLLVWGMLARVTYVLHATWLVNSATHLWGYRNYECSDDSRNLWWVAMLTWGEGWHNNHHAHPRMANHGHQWWEVDLTYRTIWVMEKLGLAWNVARKKSNRWDEVEHDDHRQAA